MVKNSIKVYARLKKEFVKKPTAEYHISRRTEHEDLVFNTNNETDPSLNKPHKYRFTKVFDQISSQVEVFNAIAKPIINSVFNGFNGTIFAYGQTGSGKTYAITGSSNEYDERGILPRSIEQIFEYIKTTSARYSIYVSYLEIYNENGYDLLNSKHRPSRLEELPRVALLEDANGEVHLRNLSVLPVTNEQEAMRLLFLGDTNRTIAETPMNEYSSRSHCIFTIYVTIRSEKSERIRRSKLHLVDLAGSERIHKSKISGVTLNEAKHINLSLHYLEQVIIALSQTSRSHIPFRNSMMTYILRDSLSGNSLTAMLATLALTRRNIPETLTTCKFSQRVACICTEATINEEIDPQKEILFLRQEVDELRRQLIQLKGINGNEKLNEKQTENCRNIINEYVKGSTELPADLTGREMRYCMKLMKGNINRNCNQREQNLETSNSTLLMKYNAIISLKDEEIAVLRQLLDTTSNEATVNNTPTGDGTRANDPFPNRKLSSSEEEVFSQCKEQRSKDIDQMNLTLNKKYDLAKNVVSTVQKCQDNIINIRKKLSSKKYMIDDKEKLRDFLLSQQNIYRDSLRQLERLKKETDFLRESLKQAKLKLIYKSEQEKDHFVREDSNEFCHGVFSDVINENPDKIKPPNYYCLSSSIHVEKIPKVIPSTLTKSNYISNNFSEKSKYCMYPKPNLTCSSAKPTSFPYQNPCKNIEDYNFSNDYNINIGDDNNCSIIAPEKDFSNTREEEALERLITNNFTEEPVNNSEYGSSSSNFQYVDCKVKENVDESNVNDDNKNISLLRNDGDTREFLEFMKTVPLTGDIEVDEEIFNFYRTKFIKK